MFTIVLFTAVALALGLTTAVRARRTRGWGAAVLLGAAVTVATVTACLISLFLVTFLALLGAGVCGYFALTAYDEGRVWTASCWMALAGICSYLSGWWHS